MGNTPTEGSKPQEKVTSVRSLQQQGPGLQIAPGLFEALPRYHAESGRYKCELATLFSGARFKAAAQAHQKT